MLGKGISLNVRLSQRSMEVVLLACCRIGLSSFITLSLAMDNVC